MAGRRGACCRFTSRAMPRSSSSTTLQGRAVGRHGNVSFRLLLRQRSLRLEKGPQPNVSCARCLPHTVPAHSPGYQRGTTSRQKCSHCETQFCVLTVLTLC